MKELSLLILLSLTYLLANISNLLSTRARLVRKTRITKKVLGAERAKNKIVIITPLQQVLIPISSKRKRKTSPKLSISTAIGRSITPPSVSSKKI